MINLNKNILKISALFHDIGKSNLHFQNKLKIGGMVADYFRHEYISFLFFYSIIKYTNLKNEKEIFLKLSDNSFLLEAINFAINNTSKELNKNYSKIPLTSYKDFENNPLLYSISFLILSHHKMLDLKTDALDGNSLINKLNNNDNKINVIKDNKSLILKDVFVSKENVLNELSELFKAISNHSYNKDVIQRQCSTILKLSFLLSDRYGSVLSKENDYDPNLVYAKSFHSEKVFTMGDTLEEHSLNVKESCDYFNNLIININDISKPQFSKSNKLKSIENSNIDKQSKFYWQKDVVNKINDSKDIKDSYAFIVNGAGTGSGKTIANALIASNISVDSRFTYALGLRSLTLQTNNEFIKELGVEEKDLAMLIGDSLSKTLYDMDNQDDESELNYFIVNNEYNFFDKKLECILKEKDKILVNHPLVVCTTDQIVGTANMSRSRFISSTLRLMTSDLILDEVDSYSDTDFVVLCKLAYRVGCFGRKIILSSATIPQNLCKAMFESYLKGCQFNSNFYKKEMKIYSGFFCEDFESNMLVETNDKETFLEQYSIFNDNLIHYLDNKKAKRKGEIFDINNESVEASYDSIIDKSIELHKNNNTIIDGVSVSIGFVRFNRIYDSIMFASHLMNKKELNIKTLAYHSKHLLIVSNYYDNQLTKILTRKKDELEKSELIKELVNNAQELGKKDVMILLSVTSIIEVGRDFCFDYAIAELSSLRSLVQLSGRVLRHRDKEIKHANIAITNKPIITYDNETLSDNLDLIIESKIKKNRHFNTLSSFYSDFNVESINECFENELLEKIDARLCLQYYEYGKNIGYYFQKIMDCYLFGKDKLSLDSYINHPFLSMSKYHYVANTFRNDQDNLFYYFDVKKDNFYRSQNENESNVKRMVSSNSIVNKINYNSNNLLFKFDINNLFDQYVHSIQDKVDKKDILSLTTISLSLSNKLSVKNSQKNSNVVFDYNLGLQRLK